MLSTSGVSKMRTWMRARTRWRTRWVVLSDAASHSQTYIYIYMIFNSGFSARRAAHPQPAWGASGQLLRARQRPHAAQPGGIGTGRRQHGAGQAEASGAQHDDHQRDLRHHDGSQLAAAGTDTSAAAQRTKQRSDTVESRSFLYLWSWLWNAIYKIVNKAQIIGCSRCIELCVICVTVETDSMFLDDRVEWQLVQAENNEAQDWTLRDTTRNIYPMLIRYYVGRNRAVTCSKDPCLVSNQGRCDYMCLTPLALWETPNVSEVDPGTWRQYWNKRIKKSLMKW